MTVYLARCKLLDPKYQVGPDQWVTGLREQKIHLQVLREAGITPDPPVPPPRVIVHSKEVSGIILFIGSGLREKTSYVSRYALAFLDRLGFER